MIWRERERQRQRERDRETERDRDTDTHTHTHRERETETERSSGLHTSMYTIHTNTQVHRKETERLGRELSKNHRLPKKKQGPPWG